MHVAILKREGRRDEAKALLEEGKQVGEPTDELDDGEPTGSKGARVKKVFKRVISSDEEDDGTEA